MSVRTLVLAGVLAFTPRAVRTADTTPKLHAEVDAIMAGWAKPDSPGCAVGVVKDGALALPILRPGRPERGFPSARIVFDIASPSKQFTRLIGTWPMRAARPDDDVAVRPQLPRYGAHPDPSPLPHTSGCATTRPHGLAAGYG